MAAKPPRIPAPRSFLTRIPVLHSAPDAETIQEALRLRLTCSTPTFNHSTKLSRLTSSAAPVSPAIRRGEGIGNLRRYTDYKTSLEDDPSLSSSSSLSRKSSSSSLSSRFHLKLRRSRLNLASSDDNSDAQSSRSSSPKEKPLPPLPALFSRCSSPIDDSDNDDNVYEVPAPPPFKLRRKPVPSYGLANDSVSAFDFSGTSATSDDGEDDKTNSVQRLGPNVFMTSDDAASWALATAFTHIVRVIPGDGIGGAHITFEPETRIHTLHLPIQPPIATKSGDSSETDSLSSHLALIHKSHNVIDFSSRRKLTIRRKPVPKVVPCHFSDDSDEEGQTVDDIFADFLPSPQYSHADLATTQQFLAAYGRPMSISDLASLLCDAEGGHSPLSDCTGNVSLPPLGLRPSDIATALAYLRPHPFAPNDIRRRVLLVAPRGQRQLAREVVALGTCYFAVVKDCSVRAALQSVWEASRDARRSFGPHAGEYLEELWQEVEAGTRSKADARGLTF